MIGLIPGTVKLEAHNSDWQVLFDSEKQNLQKILKDLPLSIEHIGSTSVEGLDAKPIIDIAIGVKKLPSYDSLKVLFLWFSEYSIKEDSTPGEVLVRKSSDTATLFLIHIMEQNSTRYQNTIKFRDILRSHPDIKADYQNLKRSLAKKFSSDRKKYTASKDAFINDILSKF